jgi:hypothetical protein
MQLLGRIPPPTTRIQPTHPSISFNFSISRPDFSRPIIVSLHILIQENGGSNLLAVLSLSLFEDITTIFDNNN